MNRYSRVLHHIDIEDVKLKCLDEIAAREIEEKNRKIEEEYITKKMESWGSDWRKELSEQMTTGSMMYTRLSPEGDEALDTMTVASHTSVLNIGQVVSSGSGTGDDGGFNVGQDYLKVGWTSGSDAVILKDIDTRQVDTITFSVIVGNDSNGGKAPPESNTMGVYVQSTGTADNPTGSYGTVATVPSWYDFSSHATDPNYNGPYNDIATASGILVDPNQITSAGVEDYSMAIPPWHQRKNARFALQVNLSNGATAPFSSFGVVDIKLQRKNPLNVWVGLDDPEASVFVRVGQGSGTTSPKKRKKRVQDILASGKKYTTTNMGPDFPGSNARLDDPQMPHKQVADIQQANRDGVSDRASDLWGEKDGYSFDPPGTELPIADKNILSPEHLKRLNGPGRTSVTVNGKTYRKFEDLSWDVRGPAYEAFYAWRDALDKDVTKQQNELIIAAGYGWTLPSGNKYGKATYINFGGYDPGTPEYALGQSISKLNKDAMDLSNERFREMSQRIVEIDSDGNPVTSDAGADTDIEGEESTDAEGSEEKKIVGELEADPKSDASQEGIKNILANQLNKPEMANFWEKLGKAGETFARHLTNTLPSTVDNNYLGKKYVNSAFNKASFNVDGTLDMGDNIMGTTQPPTYDSRSKEVVVPFNYDFTPNAQEFQKNKGQVNMLQKVVYTGLGKYSVDASPKFGSDPLSKVVGMGLGAVFSKSITGAETFGGGKHVPGEVRMSINDLKRTNAPLYAQMMARGVIPDPVKEKRKSKVTESVSMKKKLKTAKEFFKQADIRPTFPENPPPELDPKTGMHPNYGKQAGRYKKLDPLSAKAMPKTADPEIDAEVEKAKKKPK